MTTRRTDPVGRATGEAEFALSPTTPSASVTSTHDTHVTVGNVLWTLNQNGSTAQARRWITPNGYELELQIWTGPRVEGQEDLCWSQLFASEEALAAAATAKKHQLEGAGWLEDIDIVAR